jgi:hypothetical protein
LQWSQQLGRLPTDSPAAAKAAAAAAQPQGPHRAKGVITVLSIDSRNVWGTAMQGFFKGQPIIWMCIGAVETWLQAVSTLHAPLLRSFESVDADAAIDAVMVCLREIYNAT